jgi:hypothetical protein
MSVEVNPGITKHQAIQVISVCYLFTWRPASSVRIHIFTFPIYFKMWPYWTSSLKMSPHIYLWFEKKAIADLIREKLWKDLWGWHFLCSLDQKLKQQISDKTEYSKVTVLLALTEHPLKPGRTWSEMLVPMFLPLNIQYNSNTRTPMAMLMKTFLTSFSAYSSSSSWICSYIQKKI